jgi:hypothetical protein
LVDSIAPEVLFRAASAACLIEFDVDIAWTSVEGGRGISSQGGSA